MKDLELCVETVEVIRLQIMGRDFWMLILGLGFLLVDIHVGRFDVIPDFVGLALIGLAANEMIQYAARFKKVRDFAWPFVVLSIFTYLFPAKASQILLLVSLVLSVFLVWLLLGGVRQFSEERERSDLAKVAGRYQRIYLGLAILACLLAVAAWFEPESAASFVRMMDVVMMIYFGFAARLLWVVKEELAVDEFSAGP